MPLTVATFNVQHGRTPAGVDARLLGSTCAGLGADVLGLQEVDRGRLRSGRHDLAVVVAGYCAMEQAFASARRWWFDGDYGNALLVRGEILEVETVRLPRLRRGREPRAALLATAVVDGERASVAVTHLSTRKDESERQLAEVLAALEARPVPRLLLGDLNRRPDELALLGRAGYVVADGPPTYPAGAPRLRIDHVAAMGFEIGEVGVVPAPCSDHRPLVVRLSR